MGLVGISKINNTKNVHLLKKNEPVNQTDEEI